MRNIFYSLTGIMLLLGITACSEEERYATYNCFWMTNRGR